MLFRRDEPEFDRLRDVGKRKMGMRLDESGHQGCTLPVDDPCVAERKRRADRNDRRYPVAFDEHRAVEGRVPGTVQNADVPEQYYIHGRQTRMGFFRVYRFSIYIRFQVGLMIT